ncbi:MAG: recombinase family protein [archaeon]|nr:recombinase family protein [archaeon]
MVQDTPGNRVALYVRVSTEEQAELGFSLDGQMKRLEKYCESEGYEIAGKYVEEGCSGRSVDRPEYKRMMSEKDKWDLILVLKMDRIHRNSTNFTNMMNELKTSGKDFCSVQEQFDTKTAMGRFVMDFIQRIAQLESEQIGERVKLGMKHKAKSGKGALGSGQPYGYNYDHGQLKVNDQEAHVVKTIYDMYCNDYSMGSIASSLNESGVPAKKGGKWNRQSIFKILHNPLYAGYIKWDGSIVRGSHTAIIEYNIFKKVNANLYQI